jgi:hypothetical protein
MKAWRTSALAFVATLVIAGPASAATTKSVPVVTQVQGLTFYRTSITISNGSASVTTPVTLLFSYRSPVDGSFQEATLDLSPNLGPRRVRFFDDIIQAFKDAGEIRSQDANAALFGTLLVTFNSLAEDDKFEAAVVARTYSPAPGGGTLGIAYAGRFFCSTGSRGRVIGAMRSGIFGNDGSTRSNLGIVNEGFGLADVLISYYDGETGVLLKQFFVSSKAGHLLEENEVFQLNNIFGDSAIPASTHTLVVEVESDVFGPYITAYGVQLDNTTNDGAFFFFEEE